MISKATERMSIPVQGICNGEGTAHLSPLFGRGVLPHNVTFFTLEPGSSVGQHLHEEDNEIYLVTEGELVIQDDGVDYVLQAGDAEYCAIGHTHGIVNRSGKPATFLAITLV